MRTPGDNVTNEDLLEKENRLQKEGSFTVMVGGCGYGAGSFNPPVPKTKPRFELLSFLAIQRKKLHKK